MKLYSLITGALIFLVSLAAQAAPDMRVGSFSGSPGESFSIPVTFEGSTAQGVVGMQLRITYDDSIVTPGTPVGGSNLGSSILNSNTQTPGVLSLTVTNFSLQPINSGDIISIPFTIKQGASTGDSTSLELSGVAFSDANGNSVAAGQLVNGAVNVVRISTAKLLGGTVTGRPGEGVALPILLADNTDVYGLQFDVAYDATYFTITNATAGSDIGSATLNSGGQGPGQFRVILTDFQLNRLSNGELLKLSVVVNENAPDAAYSFELTSIVLSDEQGASMIPSDIGAAVLTVQSIDPGDANGDGVINIQDVISILSRVLSSGQPSGGSDCNGDGNLNIQDVICTLNKVLG